LACILSACSYSYVDPDGTQHIIGLVNLEISPAEDDSTLAGDVIGITTIGFSYHSAHGNSALTLGYGRYVSAALRNHVLVLGNPLTALQTNGSTETDSIGEDHESDLLMRDVGLADAGRRVRRF